VPKAVVHWRVAVSPDSFRATSHRHYCRFPCLPCNHPRSYGPGRGPVQGLRSPVDMSFRTAQLGKRIIEVPITFMEREFGESKMSGNIITEAFTNVTQWGLAARAQKLKQRFG